MLRRLRVFFRALVDIPLVVQSGRKSRDQRRIERIARLARFERMKIHGEARGWHIKASGGVACWQFISGGRFQPRTSTENG